jgi:multidrug transporter EmrE-like cation transporter
MKTPLWTIACVMVGCMIGAVGAVLFKKASPRVSFNLGKLIKNKELVWGVILYGISTIVFIIPLKYGELSVLYPFVATTYVWTSILSIKYLNEKMNALKWIGILLIIAGVAAIGLG